MVMKNIFFLATIIFSLIFSEVTFAKAKHSSKRNKHSSEHSYSDSGSKRVSRAKAAKYFANSKKQKKGDRGIASVSKSKKKMKKKKKSKKHY